MNSKVNLGDGVLDDAKANVNNKVKDLIKIATDVAFNYLAEKVKDFPEIVEQLRNKSEIEREITNLWSEHLSEENLVPMCYKGLPDNLLISNFHQEGYLDGLYTGYINAMMALADCDAPKEIVFFARDYIRPSLIGHHYKDRNEFINKYNDEKYSWIDKVRENK